MVREQAQEEEQLSFRLYHEMCDAKYGTFRVSAKFQG